ncbi:MAG: recombinase family protein [Rhodobacteraceae bacterium]|nr:recombinase family protein [Paracoccaceae bacterium]
MTKAAIYARVSTTRQADGEISLPDQIAQCEAYCARQGWPVAATYVEPGASARDDDRPQFQEMIYAATRTDQPFEVIVVHSLSRFSRDSLQAGIYTRDLDKAGVRLVSITQDLGESELGEFVRKVFHLMDEHQSRENAKHVHRAMLENARQGFWNGAKPPFGYSTKITERRGGRDKKILVIDEGEAAVVRRIFALAAGAEGPPMGVKAIATYLNQRAITRRGRLFSTGSIYDILTSTTYTGVHHFNRNDSRRQRARPPSDWIEVRVPQIVEARDFNTVQALLQSRNPKTTPPRVVNGPTFLAGLAKCAYCEAALIQNTGKGGRYRYYCCSSKLKKGPDACRGLRMRMEELDTIVLQQLERHILQPARLEKLLADYLSTARDRDAKARDTLARMRSDHAETKAAITRLLELVEKGVMDLEDPELRQRLIDLKFRRDELSDEITAMSRRMTEAAPQITVEKVRALSELLRNSFRSEDPAFRQAYARLLLDEVRVSDNDIRLSGSKDRLAQKAASGRGVAPPEVPTLVRKWRARKDSNL